jgi:hypothetical protein
MGTTLLFRPKWLNALFAATGSRPAGANERIIVPACELFAGAGWLFVWFAQVHVFPLKPLIVTFLSWFLFPASALVFIGALLWIVILRRFRGNRPKSLTSSS